MEKRAIDQYTYTIQLLLAVLDGFKPEQLNKVPFEGSWTPGQVTDHIMKAQAGTPDLLNRRAEPANREPGEKEAAIKKMFLDFNIKMKSPDFILPSDKPLDKDQLMNGIKNQSKEILNAMQANDATEVCTGFEIPGFGPFTRLEWLYFITYHTQRHVWQLERM
jgi:hypothetical protein